jgi:hypothetical protein
MGYGCQWWILLHGGYHGFQGEPNHGALKGTPTPPTRIPPPPPPKGPPLLGGPLPL